MLRRSGIAIFLSLILGSAFAQSNIVDDSTIQVYGPYTTLFQTFEGIKYNRDYLHKVDSTIGNMHNFTWVEKYNHKYQNLGNMGTALRSVFYTPPTHVGIRSGFDAYAPYYITADKIEYFYVR